MHYVKLNKKRTPLGLHFNQLYKVCRMQKILLCTIPLNRGADRSAEQLPMPPKIAIISLIKWMEKYGYGPETYDFLDIDMLNLCNDDIREYFKKTQPSIIGLSAVVSTSYLSVKQIASIAREECPSSWIVMGGYLSASANVVLNKTEVDICVKGDGEIPFLEFINYVKRNGQNKIYIELSNIKGLVYLDDKRNIHSNQPGNSIPSNEIPFPDYDLLTSGLKDKSFLVKNYFRKALGSDWFVRDIRSHEVSRLPNVANLWISKGCVANCTFCQRSSRKLHCFDVNKLEEHLKILINKFNVGFIHILDENFGANKKHTHEATKLFKKYNLLWICSGVRCTNVTEEEIKHYYDCGCCGLKFGVESGSQKILDIMEKRFLKEQVQSAIELCTKYHIYSPAAVMVGMPGETNQTVIDTGKYLAMLAYIQDYPLAEVCASSAFYAFALPGTALYEYGQLVGAIGTSIDDEEKYLIAISDRGADKINYINLVGAPMKNVLFWDVMLKLEAIRTFYKLHRKFKTKFSKELKRNIIINNQSEYNNKDRVNEPFKKITLNVKLKNICRYFLNIGRHYANSFLASRFAAHIPRIILYPILRNLIYIQFILKRTLIRYQYRHNPDRLNNLYRKYKIPPELSNKQIKLINEKHGSLRTIIMDLKINSLAKSEET